jgi:hypothetical protein
VLVRLVTCKPIPEPDPDQEPLLAALSAAGLEARLAVWDDPAESWDGGLSVIRSTWDYYHRLEPFLEKCAEIAARSKLLNPLEVVRFSAHKSYLSALAAAGLPVMPTVQLARGATVTLRDVMADKGWSDVVVKPAVSAASFRTGRFDEATLEAGEEHLRALLTERDAMIQPYLRSVEGYGERAVVWIDGAVTHSVRKSPRFGGSESVSEAIPPTEDERSLADAFVKHVSEDLLYARIDLARDERGKPLLMELELLEPSLFLLQHPPALERLVRGIMARA